MRTINCKSSFDEGHSASDGFVKAVQSDVKVRLAAHQYLRLIQFMGDFPLTTTSKIMRRKLHKLEA